MTIIFTSRLILYVSAASRDAANLMAQANDFDPACGLNTFSVPLSPDGYEPATHYATNTAATAQMADGYRAALEALPWAGLYDASDGTTWDWDGTQRDQLLQVVRNYGDQMTPTMPPWVGAGTHSRVCVLSPLAEVGNSLVADILEQYEYVAHVDYGGDSKLHIVVVTVSNNTVTLIENNSYYQILWAEAV